ncbi:MAG: D-aminoacylase [Candidatus Moranbacteria bacterium]|nr:D-aminoacylase [Candidatus Moranbacteria bacterium]
MYDIIIRNGTVIDGTGKPGYEASVGINKNKIAKIGRLAWSRGKIEIDAQGKVITPGFIDIHNHSDNHWQLFLEPNLPSLIFQGITTIIGGNCGASIVPLTAGKVIESVQKWVDMSQVNVNWLSMNDFREEMERRKFGVNFATLVGHGTLRRGIMGDEMRKLTDQELDLFRNILKRSLEDGAVGLSLGLAYSHERNANWKEIESMLEEINTHDKFFSVHLRNEGESILPALDEILDLAKYTRTNIQISHFKIMGEKNWRLMDEALGKIETAQKDGVNVNFDAYPYTQTGSVLYIYLPEWATEGGKKMLLRRLKEKHLREKIIAEMKRDRQYHYENAIIAAANIGKNISERNIAKIAESRGVSPEEVIVDLLLASDGRVITLLESLSEENVGRIIAHPLSIIASDGSGYNINHSETGELVHPRCFGTFPRVIRKYVREEKIITLEDAIKKMTSMPARKIDLRGRGVIEKGMMADVVVFDPERIRDLATVENPYQYSEGVSDVVVNGKLALRGGKLTGELAGEFITA